MSDVLPTPPTSPEESARSETSDPTIIAAIDKLLERYLHLLDEHQKLQQDIKKHFSVGFLSLACANRSCPPGRRFGEDYYDERMKAAWRVDVSTADPCKSVYESCTPHRLAVVREKSGDDGTDGASQSQDMSHSLESTVDGCKITPKSDLRFTTANPLHWFGVLVPAALRNAQTSFVSAVDGPIPALANVIIEMREVEQNVHNLRKTLLAAEILDGLEL